MSSGMYRASGERKEEDKRGKVAGKENRESKSMVDRKQNSNIIHERILCELCVNRGLGHFANGHFAKRALAGGREPFRSIS
jgi:hypothetical protein